MREPEGLRPLIAILRGLEPDEAVAVGEALIEAGIAMIEVPLNSPQPFESIERIAARFCDRAWIGAGTVTRTEEVAPLLAAGGCYAVSPDCQPDVIRASKAAGLASYPGVFTPSEALLALRSGADALKFFPAFLLGSDGFAAIRAVLPEGTRSYAVGGIGADDFASWLDAGISGFGIGSALFKPGRPAAEIAAAARDMVQAYDDAVA